MRHLTKRGIQTALVTGGMLMLGTGIASASENVDPDRPVSPIDGSITVPVDIGDNAIGTPGGQQDAPEHQGTYSSKQITDPIKEEFENNLPEGEDPFRGNRLNADLVVPVQIANNAVALLGDAEVSGKDHEQSYDGSNDVTTDGAGSSLAGNVVDADWAAPVQIANNAGGLGGNASSTDNNASQETTTGGDDTTDGSGGVIAGNVAAVQGATPVQLNNNAAGGGGDFTSTGNSASSDANSGGSVLTNGDEGVLSGNAGGVPVAFPVEANNSALTGFGMADSSGNHNAATATAGGTRPGINDIDSYIQTSGKDGVASGNVAQPQGAGDGAVHDVSGSLVGISSVGGGDSRADGANTTETSSTAGGFSSTNGDNAVLGGNLADAPVAAPVEAYCVAGTLGGISSASCENTTDADAGGGTFTTGEGSTGGGNSVNSPIATTIESFGVAAAGAGTSSADATEDKVVDAGGYNGTTGDDSTGGGNLVQTPVAAPIETFGLGGSAAGDASGSATETKDVSAGGPGNTVDDDGTLASNLIATPIAQPVQAFGIAGSLVGSSEGQGTSDTTTTSGGDYTASGAGGALSGNIVQGASSAPAQAFGLGANGVGDATGTGDNTSSSTAGGDTETDGANGEGSGNVISGGNSLPAQVFGIGGSLGGEGVGAGTNVTDSAAGGTNTTDGTGSSLGGNVVPASSAGAVSIFGDAATALGHATGTGSNDVITNAGGDSETAGDDGSLAGNVVGAHALPVAQVFGDALSLGGEATALGSNTTDATSGGDVTTSGVGGSLAGNVFDVPAAAVAQVFGNAGTIGGISTGTGDNTTTALAGGVAQTAGDNSSGSGWLSQLPLGGVLQIFGFEGPIGGQATATATNASNVLVDSQAAQIFAPVDGSEMAIDGLPNMDGLSAEQFMASSPFRAERPRLLPDASPAMFPRPVSGDDLPVATTLPAPAGLPELGGLDALPTDIAELPNSNVTTPLPAQHPAVTYPMPAPSRGDIPALPETGLPIPALPEAGLPAAPALPEAGLPAAPALPELGLPGAPALPAAPALPTDSRADVPALPALPDAGLPVAPALPELGLPGAPALPAAPALPTDSRADVPALPALPDAGLPVAPALPEAGLPAAPALPEAGLPAAPALPEAGLPAAPALPKADVAPAGAAETGFRGMWAKFVGMLTNRPMHIQGSPVGR